MKNCHPKADAPRAHKYIAVLSAILVGGLLMGCEQSAVKKAAQAADGFAISVKALQQAEIVAHVEGLIDDAEHRDLQGYFLDVANAGLQLDNAIRIAQSKPKAVEALQAALASLDRMLNQGVLHLCAPGFVLAPGTVEAASEHALLLLPHLRLLHAQRAELAARIQSVLEELAGAPSAQEQRSQHRDVTLILSLPGVGRVVAATMLAEAAQALAERDCHALRAYAGIAPVTRRSGKQMLVRMRYACNARVRNATCHWARVSVQHDALSCAHYHRLRARGHSHGRALRGVADRLLTVLCAMLRTQTPYEPTRRRARLPSAA